MRKTILALLVYLLALGGTCEAGSTDSSQIQRLRSDVFFLASDSLGGRPPGTAFELKAANYISKQFTSSGISCKTSPFDVALGKDSVLHCTNVFGFMDNKADSTIIISAHYDHLGMGNSKSREIHRKGLHPGADDNASGVAMMLELARYLKLNGSKKYNYVFAAFSAHEIGLFGSSHFAYSAWFDSLHITFLMNLDMVGRMDAGTRTIKLSYCLQHIDVKDLFTTAAASSAIHINFDDGSATQNDYNIFCEHGISAVSVSTGVHDDYHRMSDTPDRINFAGMAEIIDMLKMSLDKVIR